MKFARSLALLLAMDCLVVATPAAAHFLWLNCVDGQVHVYFSEDASPDDPQLLKSVSQAEAWASASSLRGPAKLSPIALKLGEDALVGEIPGNSSAIGLNHDYGVMTRGGETFSLRYYAKTYTNEGITTTAALDERERLPLEITPNWDGSSLVLKVTWQGKPAADVEVVASGAGLAEQLKTDNNGQVTIVPKQPGALSARARLIEAKTGSQGDKSYTSIRHYSTLTMPVNPPTMLSTDHQLPPLEAGVTSFGAAVLGDQLYVYGGHIGSAHHYSQAGQSDAFRQLSLSKPAGWRELPSGPKLTGLAMVAYDGKLYRVGGFTAKNTEDKEQDLWSQDSFAMFDPATGKWTDLPPLPAGRSSHDAAVLAGKLYVVGGWNMQGAKATQWHDKALVCDLTQPTLEWREMELPFRRRAVSVAAHQGKLYVLGGMEEAGVTTTRADIYDPATGDWTEGPALLGAAMDGFGASSFATGDRLLVTTMSGSVQQLAEDGKSWLLVGQLKHPRFFHRHLALPDGQALIVGGASMQTGKTDSLEVLSPVAAAAKE